MKIVVIGGTGLIGSQLTNILKNDHEVVAASPNTGVNTLTGEGLDQALANADIVVDVSNSPSFADDDVMKFFKTSTTNLLEAEKKAGVKHHIALSIVGTRKLSGNGYFKAKQTQEELIENSSIPYTIVHATQFFEFVGGIAAAGTKDDEVFISDSLVQPIASADVASFLATTATGNPVMGTAEIGGPERMPMSTWVSHYLTAMKSPLKVVGQKDAHYFGAPLEYETLVPQNPTFKSTLNYEDWIANPQNQR